MKHVKLFESWEDSPEESPIISDNENSGLIMISLDLAGDMGDSFLQCCQELIEQFGVQIVNLWPIGPAGGNPEVTFRGTKEGISGLVKWHCELSGEDFDSLYSEYTTNDRPIPFEVQSDKRFETSGERQFVGTDGLPK